MPSQQRSTLSAACECVSAETSWPWLPSLSPLRQRSIGGGSGGSSRPATIKKKYDVANQSTRCNPDYFAADGAEKLYADKLSMKRVIGNPTSIRFASTLAGRTRQALPSQKTTALLAVNGPMNVCVSALPPLPVILVIVPAGSRLKL